VEGELSENASVGGIVVNRTTVKVHGQSPLIGEPLPVKRGERPALISRERSTIGVLILVIFTVSVHVSTSCTGNTKLCRAIGRDPGPKLTEGIVLAFSILAECVDGITSIDGRVGEKVKVEGVLDMSY
jgi:hypothetical protein